MFWSMFVQCNYYMSNWNYMSQFYQKCLSQETWYMTSATDFLNMCNFHWKCFYVVFLFEVQRKIMYDHAVSYLLSYQLSTCIFFYKNKNHLGCSYSHIMRLKKKFAPDFSTLLLMTVRMSWQNLFHLLSRARDSQNENDGLMYKNILIKLL
jgi:hypothetical protein